MRHSVLLGLAIVAASATVSDAQTRRALVVGINRYDLVVPTSSRAKAATERAKVPNLNGAVNDALSFRDVLQARFGFEQQNVAVMTDSQATRARLLAAFDRLRQQSDSGDVVVFYYAGHGSQRKNSLSPEASKLDQTLVPADANAGAFDIRDKEIARAFNALLDKKVELVLIFDSCHSGSGARGPLDGQGPQKRERFAGFDPRDAADPGVENPPEDRGALVISATQDDRPAAEMTGLDGHTGGLFTTALVQTLVSSSPNESAANVFRSVKARMQSNGHLQEPVIAASPERQRRAVFGGAAGTPGGTTVAVLRLSSRGVVLQGGPALGIRAGAVLRKVGVPSDTGIRLKVDTVAGISESIASVTSGSRQRIAVGDRFELEQWVPDPNSGITVAMAPTPPAAASILAAATELRKLRGAPGIEWADDPTMAPADSTPSFVVRWGGAAWELKSNRGALTRLGPTVTAERVRAAIRQGTPGAARLVVSLPQTPELASQFRAEVEKATGAVRVVADPSSATYVLTGRASDGVVEYALVSPRASAATDRSSTQPSRSEWIATPAGGDGAAASRLVTHAITLAKVNTWLTLQAPPANGTFPYKMYFRRVSDSTMTREGPFTEGEEYEIVLKGDSAELAANAGRVQQRRIYILAIDSHGNGALLYPGSNVANRVPYGLQGGAWPTTIALGDSRFAIGAPFGLDSFIMLAADQVVDLEAFNWEGVRDVGSRTVPTPPGPLEELITSASKGTRAPTKVTPADWSIDRVSVVSRPKQ